MKSLAITLAVLSLSLASCKKEEKKTPEPAPTEEKAPEPVEPTTEPAPEALATSVDFEDEAEEDITAENYQDALTALEAEVAAE